MSVNKKIELRCRTALKPYENQRIKFIGFLQYVGINQEISQKIKKEHNALFVDVHGAQIISDQKPKEIHIELDHVHCQLYDRNLNNYLKQFVIFSADIYSYQSKYKNKNETRYGLKNIHIQEKMHNEFYQIKDKYETTLTKYQEMMLNHIIKEIPKNYPKLRINSLQEIKKNLMRFKTFIDRTNVLMTTSQSIYDHKELSEKKLKLFTNNPNENKTFDINKYYNVKATLNEVIVQNNLLTQKLNQQKIQYQSQMKQYQSIIQQQNKQLKFYQSIEEYLTPHQKPTHKESNDQINLASPEQLNELQNKFNQ